MKTLLEEVQSGSRGAEDTDRERIIKEFTPVIRTLAQRMAFRLPAHLDTEDLVSAGVIGLMDAMTKYDPSRETSFKTYAEFRVRGAMLDEIRSMDWVPRSVHERIGTLQKTRQNLLKKLGRPPTDDEVAAELGLTVEALDEFISKSQGAVMLSIHDLGVQEADGGKIVRMLIDRHAPDPLAEIIADDVRSTLAAAVQELPEKERLVMSLYYYDDLTMKEIGSVLKVTESRVCQIHAKAILRLKARLADLRE